MDGEPGRPRLSPPLLVAGLVLGLDAIGCQVLALAWVLTTWISLLPDVATDDGTVPAVRLGAAAVLALWCPAAAALVLGVRTRAARLTGLATAAVLAAAAAALAAAGLRPGAGVSVQLIAGVVAALVNVGVVALLLPAPRPEPFAAAPTGVIDLGDR